MKITCSNQKIMSLIEANRNSRGELAKGVYISMQYNCDTGSLCHLWIGTPETGPLLAYHAGSRPEQSDAADWWRGDCYESSDAWTPIYSRGNYGRNYVCGGNWSTHCRNLLKSRIIGKPGPGNEISGLVGVDGELVDVPFIPGIECDITTTNLDCSGGWAVWFQKASEALDDMLDSDEINRAALPAKAKEHLLRCDYDEAKKRVREVMEAFEL